MEQVGVRELRQHASRWLERVQAGESFEITDRGRPIALLGPLPAAPRSRYDELVASGELVPPEDPDAFAAFLARPRVVEAEPGAVSRRLQEQREERL